MSYTVPVFEIAEYQTEDGRRPFSEWIRHLGDSSAVARIDARIARLTSGLFGDCKPVGQGVWELRINWGPGYRVYYAQAGRRLLLLLCGGDKRRQQADIHRAIEYWQDWQAR